MITSDDDPLLPPTPPSRDDALDDGRLHFSLMGVRCASCSAGFFIKTDNIRQLTVCPFCRAAFDDLLDAFHTKTARVQ